MRALDLVAKCAAMSQIVTSCLVDHGGGRFGTHRVKVGATRRYEIVGTGAQVAPHLERAIGTPLHAPVVEMY